MPENKVFTLANGKTLTIADTLPLQRKGDFSVSQGCLDELEPRCLAIERLQPLSSYAVFGAGEKVTSSYEHRPWQPRSGKNASHTKVRSKSTPN